jgi:hypothetical protein
MCPEGGRRPARAVGARQQVHHDARWYRDNEDLWPEGLRGTTSRGTGHGPMNGALRARPRIVLSMPEPCLQKMHENVHHLGWGAGHLRSGALRTTTVILGHCPSNC